MDTNIKIKNIKPEISVLMPIYNGEKYLKEAIDSILSQTFTNFELIAINDGSKDNSLEMLKSYKDPRLIIINNPINKGLIGSLNIGLDKCRGKYTARFDQDDICFPDRFTIQYDFMEKHLDIDLVGGWTECIDSNSNSLKISRNPENTWVIRYELIFNNVMFHSSIFFRTNIIKKKGGYSEQYIHSEDYEMYSRPGKELRCSNIQKPLFKLRIHGESITGSGNTKPTVYANALNVSFRNINQYIDLNRDDFEILKDFLIIKKPMKNITVTKAMKTLFILKEITNKFIKKNSLNKENVKMIKDRYKGKRKMIWENYFISKYRSILGS